MNVLFISYNGLTDPLGQSQILPYMEGLSKLGVNITILSTEKDAALKKNKQTILKICKKANINWQHISYTKKPPLLSTIYDYYKLYKKAKIICRKQNIDIIHARSYIPSLVGLRLKRKTGVKFLFDMRGFYADERVDGKIWNLNNPIFNMVYNFFKKKEKTFYLDADHMVSLTKAGKKIIQRQHIKAAPISVIPCCADLDLFNYQRIGEENNLVIRKELNIDTSSTIIAYLGSIGTWYMLDEMLDFFKEFLKFDDASTFLFITQDKPEVILEHSRKKDIVDESIRIMSADRKEVPNYLGAINYGLFFIKPVLSKKASSPTKQGELMGMGLPIVCNDIGDTGNIIEDGENGVVISEFSSSSYKNAISKLLGMEFNSQDIRNTAFKYYDLNTGVKKYYNIYLELVNG